MTERANLTNEIVIFDLYLFAFIKKLKTSAMKSAFQTLLLIAFVSVLSVSANSPEKDKNYYNERFRPQFHFSAEANHLSHPSGLIWFDGEYHLFYRYNPVGKEEGFSHWGHAISTDLISWEHRPIALKPDEDSRDIRHCTILSGSGLVDENNVLGKQTDDVKTLILFYTSAGCGQRMAYSTDKGRTWLKYENNPVIPVDENDEASDPRVFFHRESGKYVMILARIHEGERALHGFSFYTSSDLLNWEWTSHFPGFSGKPDLVELAVNRRPDDKRWVLIDGDGSYIIGRFDGENFRPESPKLTGDYGANFYGAQTWTHDGRTIQIAWMKNGDYPEMPFNGQMTFPVELSLVQHKDGLQLHRNPVAEIEKLHDKRYSWENRNLIPGLNKNLVSKVKHDCLHIVGEFDVKTSDNFGFVIRSDKRAAGTELICNVPRAAISLMGKSIPLEIIDNKVKIEMLIDRSSIEVFMNDGKTTMSFCFDPEEKNQNIYLFTIGGELLVEKLDIFSLKSAWRNK